jgi:hypothetical protein
MEAEVSPKDMYCKSVSFVLHTILPFILIIILPNFVYSYINFQTTRSPDPSEPMILDSKDHNMNRVMLNIQNTGQIGRWVNPPGGGIWPQGTENNYIFGSGLWFGAKADVDDDGDLDKVFVQGYETLTQVSEFDPGRVGQDPDDPLARIFDSNDTNDLIEWPNEFRDPDTGDPLVHSLQDFVTIYNDVSGEPVYGISNLGIEVRQRSMAFTRDLSENVIYFEWNLTNTSDSMPNGPYTFEDAWIGFDLEPDVGIRDRDDLSSFFREIVTPEEDTLIIDAAIAWDEDFDELNFIGTPGFVGLAYIQTPGNDSDGIDNDSDGFIDESTFNGIDDDGDGNIDEPDEVDELGLINYSQHCSPSGPCEVIDPQTDQDGYDILSCISEENPDSNSIYICMERTEPEDIRLMISSGPFDWLPGQTIRILFAILFAPPSDSISELEFTGDPPRPDPNDPALADFIATVLEAREFARSGFKTVGISHDWKASPSTHPRSLALSQNYPNPFNPSTTIQYDIPDGSSPAQVEINIYDVRGRLVRKLVDQEKVPGHYQIHWDGRDKYGQQVSSGVYLYRIDAGEFNSTRKMVLVR